MSKNRRSDQNEGKPSSEQKRLNNRIFIVAHSAYLEFDRFDESFLPACKLGRSFWRFFVSRQIR